MAPETPSLVSLPAPSPTSLLPWAATLAPTWCAPAPQNPGVSCLQAGTSSYAPLVDTSVIDSVSQVAPQMYNDAIP